MTLCTVATISISVVAQRPQGQHKPTGPWMKLLSLRRRMRCASLSVMKELTLDEKIALLHGVGMPTDDPVTPENADSNRGVGHTQEVKRLYLPGIDSSRTAAYGGCSSGVNGRYSTALPGERCGGTAGTPTAPAEYGKLTAPMMRAGLQHGDTAAADMMSEIRNGRTFEYLEVMILILAEVAGGVVDPGNAVAERDWR